jgi:UDP-glucose 4-epimerase
MTDGKVLITGVAGFIGSHVARRFVRDGYEVVGVDDLSSGDLANVPKGVTFHKADLAADGIVDLLPRDCRIVLHLAGQSSGEISFDDPEADLRKNTISTLNLIRYGMANHVERLVYASSMSVYGSVADEPVAENHPCAPLSCYGIGKQAAENYLRVYANGLPFVALRMFNVYGPGQNMLNMRQGMVSIYLAQALASGRIEVKGSIDRFRDFVYVDDVVDAWVRAASSRSALRTALNVGTGVRTTVAQLLQRICALVPGSSYFLSSGTPGDQTGIYADTTRSRECLGLEPSTDLARGLAQFVDWARSHAASGVVR